MGTIVKLNVLLLTGLCVLSSCGKKEVAMEFAKGTKLRACNSYELSLRSAEALNQQKYMTAMNTLAAMERDKMCTKPFRIAEGRFDGFRLEVEQKEDPIVFRIVSVNADKYMEDHPVKVLRDSDRIYYAIYHEYGGGEVGWKGYESSASANRTTKAFFDFLGDMAEANKK